MSSDLETARAFSTSWRNIGAVYSREQFIDWLSPIDPTELSGKEVLELGFGNGSLLAHAGSFAPRRLAGVELGDTIAQTRANLAHLPPSMLDLHQGDLTQASLGEFDFVYCIGVLHHLADPRSGFEAVLRSTRSGGRFHCWVYAREGNALVRWLVDPLRRVTSRLPWWLTKYGVALPLAVPFYGFARTARLMPRIARHLPLGQYLLWICRERFSFFHHVAFDQLVTPRTVYIDRATIDEWLTDPCVNAASSYVIMRNGNSWKFGGRRG